MGFEEDGGALGINKVNQKINFLVCEVRGIKSDSRCLNAFDAR